MPKAGDVIAERYRLVAPIASGGMGAVWRAEHLELGVEVALKVLLEDAKTPSAERRFRQEAQAAARLRSPHVVQVQDFGVVDGQPFLVMELLAGEDLASRLEGGGPMAPEACARVLDGVAKAVHLAHEHGIIHRDLKPANIFLAREGGEEVVKVLDFGIAKVEGSASGASTTGAGLVGSPAYMSPEQVWVEPLTSATDLWSMGVVLFEMLVGRNPFDDGPLARIFQHIVTDPIPRVSELRPGLPEGLDAFFERALARDAASRFPDALSFASAFRRAVASGLAQRAVVTAVPPSAVPDRGAIAVTRSVDVAATTFTEAPSTVASRPRRSGFVMVAAVVVVGGVALLLRASFAPGPGAEPGVSGSATAGGLTSGIEPAAPTPASPEAKPPSAPSSTGSTPPERVPPAAPSTSPPRGRPSGKPTAPLASSSARGAPTSAPGPSVDPLFGIPQKAR